MVTTTAAMLRREPADQLSQPVGLVETDEGVRVGHFDQPQCREVCPVDCIPVNPDFVETPAALQLKYEALMKKRDEATA